MTEFHFDNFRTEFEFIKNIVSGQGEVQEAGWNPALDEFVRLNDLSLANGIGPAEAANRFFAYSLLNLLAQPGPVKAATPILESPAAVVKILHFDEGFFPDNAEDALSIITDTGEPEHEEGYFFIVFSMSPDLATGGFSLIYGLDEPVLFTSANAEGNTALRQFSDLFLLRRALEDWFHLSYAAHGFIRETMRQTSAQEDLRSDRPGYREASLVKSQTEGLRFLLVKTLILQPSLRNPRTNDEPVFRFYVSLLGSYLADIRRSFTGLRDIAGESLCGVTLPDPEPIPYFAGKERELFDHIIVKERGKGFKALLTGMEALIKTIPAEEGLRETTRNWFDFMAGLIIFIDDLGGGDAKKNVHPTLIRNYICEILVCGGMIEKAVAAVGLLKSKDDAAFHPKFLKNQLHLAENYSLNILPRQEGFFKIIKRNNDVMEKLKFY